MLLKLMVFYTTPWIIEYFGSLVSLHFVKMVKINTIHLYFLFVQDIHLNFIIEEVECGKRCTECH